MLLLALKTAWFVLSLVGLLASLLSVPAARKALDCLWIPLTYSATNVVLQGAFCLGLTWRMDPFLMPRAFCISQATLMTVAWYTLTAMCTCITFATSLVVHRSYKAARVISVVDIQGVLRWRPIFLSIMVGFPVPAVAAYVAVALRLNALQPSDDMHCDATSPVWVRLLSYAGLPLLFAVPSFIVSCISVLLLSRDRHQHHSQSATPSLDNLTPVPSRRGSTFKYRQSLRPAQSSLALQVIPNTKPISHNEETIPRSTPTPSMILHSIPSLPPSRRTSPANISGGRAPISPPLAEYMKRYHLPFSWQFTDPSEDAREPPKDAVECPGKSPSPLLFASPSTTSSARTSPVARLALPGRISVSAPGACVEQKEATRQDMAHVLTDYIDVEDDADDSVSGSIRWATDSASSWSKSEIEFARVESTMDEAPLSSCPVQPPFSDFRLPDRSSARLSPLVWRILAFQLVASSTQVLAAISSLADAIAGNSPPTPFGTQHVALLLAAWTPCIVFGMIPPGCAKKLAIRIWSSRTTRTT